MTKWKTAALVSVATLASIVWGGSTAPAAVARSSESMPGEVNATPVQVPIPVLFAVVGFLGAVAIVLLLRERFVHERPPKSPGGERLDGRDKRSDDVTSERV